MSAPDRALAYERHTGRYAGELAAAFVRFADVAPGMRALDVGCGPGALAEELARVVGASEVGAVDPTEEYVAACRQRVPNADLRLGTAEELPFEDHAFEAVLAQLVVQVLDDPPRAAREMVRVAAPGGVAAACVWDFGGEMPLLSAYWGAAKSVDPDGARRAAGDDTDPWCTTRRPPPALARRRSRGSRDRRAFRRRSVRGVRRCLVVVRRRRQSERRLLPFPRRGAANGSPRGISPSARGARRAIQAHRSRVVCARPGPRRVSLRPDTQP